MARGFLKIADGFLIFFFLENHSASSSLILIDFAEESMGEGGEGGTNVGRNQNYFNACQNLTPFYKK